MKSVCILFLLLLSLQCFCQSYIGKAVKIADGDTFTLLTEDNITIKVRLHGIDCPERGQPFGTVATEFTRGFLNGKTVRVDSTDTDRYGRMIGMVYVDSVNLNEVLLKAGLAWHYKHFDKRPEWGELERKARTEKVGLWSERNPIAPWDWRKRK